MHAQRIDVFNKTYRNNIVVRITHDLKFQFFPAEHRLFHQHLPDQACLQAALTDDF